MTYTTELTTAAALAREAGAAIMRFYGTTDSTAKEGGSPVTAADHAANRVIVAGLAEAFPGDAILSEESADSPTRLAAERVWIVDPLDGTREFLSQNGEFAVMIGLAVDGAPVLGVVYLPDGDVLYEAAAGQGAWRTDASGRTRLSRSADPIDSLRLVGSRSHSDPLTTRIAERLDITDVAPCGSVGVKCSRIAEDRRDLYVHPVPYLREWDTCAPEVIAREAGALVTDCYGDPLRYNKPEPVQPRGILVRAPGCGDSVLEVVREVVRGALPPGERTPSSRA